MVTNYYKSVMGPTNHLQFTHTRASQDIQNKKWVKGGLSHYTVNQL